MVAVILLLTLIVVLSAFYLLYYDVDWQVHRRMLHRRTSDYTTIKFDEFKKEFDSIKWRQDPYFKSSIYDEIKYPPLEYNSRCFASTIKINGTYYLLKNAFEYKKAVKHIKKYIEENF